MVSIGPGRRGEGGRGWAREFRIFTERAGEEQTSIATFAKNCHLVGGGADGRCAGQRSWPSGGPAGGGIGGRCPLDKVAVGDGEVDGPKWRQGGCARTRAAGFVRPSSAGWDLENNPAQALVQGNRDTDRAARPSPHRARMIFRRLGGLAARPFRRGLGHDVLGWV